MYSNIITNSPTRKPAVCHKKILFLHEKHFSKMNSMRTLGHQETTLIYLSPKKHTYTHCTLLLILKQKFSCFFSLTSKHIFQSSEYSQTDNYPLRPDNIQRSCVTSLARNLYLKQLLLISSHLK